MPFTDPAVLRDAVGALIHSMASGVITTAGPDGDGVEHAFEVELDGDGWNEPESDRYTCLCGSWSVEWVQHDPSRSGRPEPDQVLIAWRDHLMEHTAEQPPQETSFDFLADQEPLTTRVLVLTLLDAIHDTHGAGVRRASLTAFLDAWMPCAAAQPWIQEVGPDQIYPVRSTVSDVLLLARLNDDVVLTDDGFSLSETGRQVARSNQSLRRDLARFVRDRSHAWGLDRHLDRSPA